MDKDIIEALHGNKKAFLYMDREHREKAYAIGRSNFFWLNSSGDYDNVGQVTDEKDFSLGVVYRLSRDYSPTPQVTECEVKVKDGDLWWFS
jgi:hypothetical protein